MYKNMQHSHPARGPIAILPHRQKCWACTAYRRFLGGSRPKASQKDIPKTPLKVGVKRYPQSPRRGPPWRPRPPKRSSKSDQMDSKKEARAAAGVNGHTLNPSANTTRSHIRRHTVSRSQSHGGGLGAAPVNMSRLTHQHQMSVGSVCFLWKMGLVRFPLVGCVSRWLVRFPLAWCVSRWEVDL